MSGVRKGERWGAPSTAPADTTTTGDDRALARVVADALAGGPGSGSQGSGAARVRIAWRAAPDADFARAVSATRASDETPYDLPCDALRVTASHGAPGVAVNMAVLGTAPDRARWWDRSARVRVSVDGRVVHDGRATGVVVANGEFLRGAAVIVRGHPGDGRLEVQVYAVPRGQRGALRRRVRTASHVPHPGIVQASGRRVEIEVAGHGWALESDGLAGPRTREVVVEILPEAFVLVT